jgi:hypothetical protein
LAKRLKGGVDPVPCPDCGWYQAAMVREVRRRTARPLIWLGVVPLILAAVIFGLAVLAARGVSKVDPQGWRLLAGVAGVAGAMAAAAFGSRWWIQRGLDLNRDFPVRGAPYPGAPVAWKLDGSTAATQPAAAAEPAHAIAGASLGYERRRPEVLPGGWIVVQLARVTLPNVCCCCMSPTGGVYTLGYHDVLKIPLRMCGGCTRREQRRFWKWFAGGFGVAWVLIAWLSLRSTRMSHADVVRALCFIGPIVAGLLGIVTGAIGSRAFSGAVALRRFAPDLNTIQIRFRNAGYTDLFLDCQRSQPGRGGGGFDPHAPRLSA